MATASELFRDGQLDEAIEAVTREVKGRPNDAEPRTFLFELLCFAGDLDRAEKQLTAIGQLNADSQWAVQVYQNILVAERNRRRLLSDGLKPEFLVDPPSYIAWSLEAINRLRESRPGEARELFERIEQERPEISGTCQGTEFDEFRDGDDLFAPVLEFIMLRDYIWVPLEQIRQLEVSPPERPRDLVWAPTRIVLADGVQRRGYTPVLYPGSEAGEDPKLRLGRATDWLEDEAGNVRGIGMRVFMAGWEAVPVLEAGTIDFNARP